MAARHGDFSLGCPGESSSWAWSVQGDGVRFFIGPTLRSGLTVPVGSGCCRDVGRFCLGTRTLCPEIWIVVCGHRTPDNVKGGCKDV
ncbi:MAG: hypothetical protein HWN51_07330 [Desulfobacterales bacterium]|nr:hypothetical protein [Desulfobacterales bacterium]